MRGNESVELSVAMGSRKLLKIVFTMVRVSGERSEYKAEEKGYACGCFCLS